MSKRARIVVVDTNDGEFIAAAIESALEQSVPCEVVVANNASTDGSIEMIRSRYPAVRIVDTGGNLGFGRAATIGAFAQPVEYEYVAFLNPDAIARPAWIERMTAWMEREGVDVASSVVSGAAEPFFVGGRWLAYLGTAFKRSRYAGERTDWVSGCAMVVRGEAFRALGGFDPAYFLYCEDVDLSLRARARGMRLGIFRESLVAHPEEGRSTGRWGSLRKRCFGLVSKGVLVRRFTPPFALPTALLFQCAISPALNGGTLREYPPLVKAFLRGFCGKGSGHAPL